MFEGIFGTKICGNLTTRDGTSQDFRTQLFLQLQLDTSEKFLDAASLCTKTVWVGLK